jgi:hypothetical protein
MQGGGPFLLLSPCILLVVLSVWSTDTNLVFFVAFFLVDVLHAADALSIFVGVLVRATTFSVRRSTQQPVHNGC